MTMVQVRERPVVDLPPYAKELFESHRFKSLRGGRHSTKTWSVAHSLAVLGARTPLRIFAARAFQKNLEESSKPAIQTAIHRSGLSGFYTGLQAGSKRITGRNGTTFSFHGLERNRTEIKGWEGVDICWVEEAESITEATWKILIPTIMRSDVGGPFGEGAEMWFTWNPVSRTSPIWKRTVEKPRRGDVSLLINYNQPRIIKFIPLQAIEEAEAVREEDPLLWEHLYLGMPDDGGMDTRVLGYSVLRECVDGYRAGLHEGLDRTPYDAGLDIADAGADRNSLTLRSGPVLDFVRDWPTLTPGHLTPTARKALRLIERHSQGDLWRMNYDAGGVGAPIKGEFARLRVPFTLRPINFGQKVGGPLRYYERMRTNRDAFARRNAQMGFALRLRSMRTVRLRKGEDVDPRTCLFINPHIPKLEHFLSQLSRPLWRPNPTTGKIEIDKRGENEENVKSPDKYDSTVLAFARDSDSGLRAR